MSARPMSRRGLLGLLVREPPPAPARQLERATELDEPAESPPPWVARERARVVAREARQIARIAPFACMAASGCTVCSERCPEPGAITWSFGRPRVEAERCTGCGACQEACPAPLRAITLLPVLPTQPPR